MEDQSPRTAKEIAEAMDRMRPRARMATMPQLRSTLIPSYLDPVPPPKTLARWFDEWQIPRMKANPRAKHGGGTLFYLVSPIEKALRQRCGLMGGGEVEGGGQ
jgi:hypothetical protein